MTLTQAFLNGIAASLVPFGVIQLWYGTAGTVPAGYAVCDGSIVAKSDGSGSVTVPDLRGRVPVGASATHATGTTFGQDSKTVTSEVAGAHTHTGNTSVDGAHTHTVDVAGHALTIAELPAHTHPIPSNAGSGGGSLAQSTGGSAGSITSGSTGGGEAHTHTATVPSGGAHSHALSITGVADHAHQVTVDVVQASIALHYIMKV